MRRSFWQIPPLVLRLMLLFRLLLLLLLPAQYISLQGGKGEVEWTGVEHFSQRTKRGRRRRSRGCCACARSSLRHFPKAAPSRNNKSLSFSGPPGPGGGEKEGWVTCQTDPALIGSRGARARARPPRRPDPPTSGREASFCRPATSTGTAEEERARRGGSTGAPTRPREAGGECVRVCACVASVVCVRGVRWLLFFVGWGDPCGQARGKK